LKFSRAFFVISHVQNYKTAPNIKLTLNKMYVIKDTILFLDTMNLCLL